MQMTYFGLIIGALYGAYLAWKRKGAKLDILHYAAGFGIAFALLFFAANVIYLRIIM